MVEVMVVGSASENVVSARDWLPVRSNRNVTPRWLLSILNPVKVTLPVESAAAVLDHGRRQLGLKRLVAITAPENHGSIAVLERIGLKFERMVRFAADPHDLKLFGPGDGATDSAA